MTQVYSLRDIARKYAGNDLRGRQRLDKMEVTTIGPGWPKKWATAQNTAFLYTPESENLVWQRAIRRISEIALISGILLWRAVRNYPLHSTIQAGDVTEKTSDLKNRTAASRLIAQNKEVKRYLSELSKLSFTFKYLIIDGNNVTLNAVEIPSVVVEFRRMFWRVLEEHGFQPLDMENILHLSLTRMRELPNKDHRAERYAYYKRGLINLRHEISRNPIVVKVDKVFLGFDVMNRDRWEF